MGVGVGLKVAALQNRIGSPPPGFDSGHMQSHTLAHLAATTLSCGVGASSAHFLQLPTSISSAPVSDGSAGQKRAIHTSPEGIRRESSSQLGRVPEDTTIQFDHEAPGNSANGDSEEDEEEAENELDEELEEQGLYRGSYNQLLALYTLAPLTSIVTFLCFAGLPDFLYSTSPSAYPYSPLFPFPFPEILVSVSLWCFSYLLRDPLYNVLSYLASYLPVPPAVPILLSAGIHTLVSLALQQSSLLLLLVPQFSLSRSPTVIDPAFTRVWWIALGWAAAEAVAAVKQGYEGLALYRNVIVTAHRNEDSEATVGSRSDTITKWVPPKTCPGPSSSSLDDLPIQRGEPEPEFDEEDELRPLLSSPCSRGHPNGNGLGNGCATEEAYKMQVDQDIEELIALRSREELEEVYGVPIIRIPVFISCLQRVNSVLMSLGVCLLLSHAYMCSTFLVYFSPGMQSGEANMPLLLTLPLVVTVQFGLAVLHTPLVLPVLGVPTVVYTGSLVSLGTFFAGLGVWEGLV